MYYTSSCGENSEFSDCTVRGPNVVSAWSRTAQNASTGMTTVLTSVSAPTTEIQITPLQARLQAFSSKTCTDLGISVQQKPGSEIPGAKKHCSLEGFNTKQVDAGSTEKGVDVNGDDSSDEDYDGETTECKLCNMKFEKAQVFLYIILDTHTIFGILGICGNRVSILYLFLR